MEKPSFDKLPSHLALDPFLRDFYVDGLGYAAVDKDPGAGEPDSAKAWLMVLPAIGSRPFAIGYERNLGSMRRRDISSLYISRVIPHRDGSPPTAPALYGFTDGVRNVFFSADPARNRDDRFDLSEETWQFGAVREKLARLHADRLEFATRLGRKQPRVEFLFESSPLSADAGFKRYVQVVRTELMQAILDSPRALGAVLYHLLETPQSREDGKTRFVGKDLRPKKSPGDLHLQLGMRLGEAVAGAVDTLLLRCVMVRFLESYHPEAMEGLLTSAELLERGKGAVKRAPARGRKGTAAQLDLLTGSKEQGAANFSDVELELARRLTAPLGIDVSKAKAKAKGKDEQMLSLFTFEDEPALAEALLSEEEKREKRFGGDFYLADLGRAARCIERVLLMHPRSAEAKLLEDFLGRTGAPEKAQWDFRYEDLKPKAIQDYYESSLGTAVQLTYDEKTKTFRVAVGKSQRQRKERGAYYTDERLCRFMVESTVKPLFEERLGRLRKAIVAKNAADAGDAFDSIVGMSICDPTIGSAPFLRSAFDYLSEQYLPLHRAIAEAKAKIPPFYESLSPTFSFLAARGGRMDDDGVGRWEWHILRRMLYGVDIDLKAVCISCQTFALSALKYLKQGERFPSFFNLNLKLGNSLISPVKPSKREQLAKDHGMAIARLIELRRQAMTLPNTERAYERFAALVNEIEDIKAPIVKALVEANVAPILEVFTEELRPFCCELEFPEVFFRVDGALKAEPGFDVMIGNPPWEEIDVDDNQFFGSFDARYLESDRHTRKARRARLLEAAPVAAKYQEARSLCDVLSRFVNDGGYYELQRVSRTDGRKGFTPQNNYFRMAAELFYNNSSPVGRVSVVAPQGIVGDEGGKALRGLLFEATQMLPVLAYREKNEIFPHAQAFAVVSFKKGGSTAAVALIAGLSSAAELLQLPKAVAVPIEMIKRCSPLSWGLISAPSRIDLDVISRLYEQPALDDSADPSWAVTLGTEEINETRGAYMWTERPTEYVMRKGEFTEAYRVRSDVAHYLKPREFRSKAAPDCDSWRVVWRGVINEDAERRMLWAVVPPKSGIGNSLNWVAPGLDQSRATLLVCVMNSFVVEYRARQLSSNNNMSKFIIKQVPFPRLADGTVLFNEIVRRGTRLLGQFWKPCLERNGYLVYPGMEIDEVQRGQLQNEVDALVALVFGLTLEELRYVLFSPRFHKVGVVKKEEILKVFGEVSRGVGQT